MTKYIVQWYNENVKRKQLIIDASCIMAIVRQEDTADEVIQKSEGYELMSAKCLPYDVGNSLSKWLKRDLLTVEAAQNCYNLFRKIPVNLLDVDFENSLRYSGEERHYIYDMFYLDCALRIGCPILTFNERLISIAKKRGVVCL